MFPRRENEVIALFRATEKYHGWQIVKTQRFPDAIIRKGNETLGVEFEYKAGNFYAHGHDLDPNLQDCDLVICWKGNWADSAVPVWELSKCPLLRDVASVITQYVPTYTQMYDLRIELRSTRKELTMSQRDLTISQRDLQRLEKRCTGLVVDNELLDLWSRY